MSNLLNAFGVIMAAALGICPLVAHGDCSFTTTGNAPLDDLGPGIYKATGVAFIPTAPILGLPRIMPPDLTSPGGCNRSTR